MKRPQRYNENGDRRCSSCKQYKPVSNFHKDTILKDGLAQRCKDCVRKYQSENAGRMSAKAREWQKANPEKVTEYFRKYYQTHKEAIKLRVKNHKGGRKPEYSRNWRARNRELSRERSREYRMAHPEIAMIRAENRRARKLCNGGKVTKSEWDTLKKKYDYTCLCCGMREPEIKLTMDHVLPLAMGGKHAIENAQPLCKSCNSKKHTKHIDYRPLWRAL